MTWRGTGQSRQARRNDGVGGASKGRILGATLVGPHAGETIGELVLAMTRKVRIGELGAVIHPYPTLSEAVKRLGDDWNCRSPPPRGEGGVISSGRVTAEAHRKVLLIDDSEISLHFAAAVLERAGYDVRTSTSIHEFDAALDEWRPDVILTDVQMPGVSGVELCRLLKSRYDTAHVPVVLFSAIPPEELEGLARDCEADGYLSKVNGLDRLPEELALLIDNALF